MTLRAIAVRACRCAGWMCAASLVLSCGFDARPTLGWQDDAGLLARDAPATSHAPQVPNTPSLDRDAGTQIAVPTDPLAPPSAGLNDAGMDALPSAAGAGALIPGADPVDAAAPESDASPPADADKPVDASVVSPSCHAGAYSGMFDCIADLAGIPISTTIDFVLDPPSANTALATTTANVTFTYEGATFLGELSGQLDCKTGRFHADIRNGLVGVVPVPLAGFEAAIDGRTDLVARTLGGQWSMYSPLSGTTCAGTWTAPLRP